MVVVVAALALALLLLALTMVRVLRNVGPLSLEENARRSDCVYLPVSREVLKNLGAWSTPVRIRIEQRGHPMLATLLVDANIEEEPT